MLAETYKENLKVAQELITEVMKSLYDEFDQEKDKDLRQKLLDARLLIKNIK
jgi:hypothetical protein